jgi:hypothetical protein
LHSHRAVLAAAVTGAVLAGGAPASILGPAAANPPRSRAHLGYVAAEVVKVIILICLGASILTW